MTKFPEEHPSPLDDMLAAFTDRALNSRPAESTRLATSDPELFALEQTVLQLKKTFEDAVPEAQAARRIRTRLEQQWRLERQRAAVKTPAEAAGWRGLLKRFSQLPRFQRQRTLAFGFALACVVLLAGLVIFAPVNQTPPTGAAGMAAGWLPFAIGFIVIAIAAVIWLIRPKDR